MWHRHLHHLQHSDGRVTAASSSWCLSSIGFVPAFEEWDNIRSLIWDGLLFRLFRGTTCAHWLHWNSAMPQTLRTFAAILRGKKDWYVTICTLTTKRNNKAGHERGAEYLFENIMLFVVNCQYIYHMRVKEKQPLKWYCMCIEQVFLCWMLTEMLNELHSE